MGVASRGERVRLAALQGAARARAPGCNRRALRVAEAGAPVQAGDRRGGGTPLGGAERHRRRASRAHPRRRHPVAARAATSGGAGAGGRQPGARAPAERDRVRHRPRARPVCAQPLLGGAAPFALAERRHLPRAERAGALDSGRPPAGGDLLRAPRRPRGLVADHRRADRALFPGGVRAGRAGRGPRRRAVVAGRPGRRRADADRVLPRRGARRPAPLPTRAPTNRRPARMGGGGVDGGADGAAARPGAPRSRQPRRAARDGARAADRRRRRPLRLFGRAGRRPGADSRGARHRDPAGDLSDPALRRAHGRRRGGAPVSAWRRDHAGGPARAAASRLRPARPPAARCGVASTGLGGGCRPGREHLRPLGRAPPRSARRPRHPAADLTPPRDRRRPAHAHRPFLGLRDLGRDPVGNRPRRRPRRDRDHGPQRGLGRARRTGDRRRLRGQGDRRRGGEDRRGGRGDRSLRRGEDPARDVDGRDDRRDPQPGRAGLRPPPLRPPALGPRLRAPARDRRADRHPRGLQPAGGPDRVQRGGGAVCDQVPDRPRRRLGQPRRPGARLA